jgi:single-strand DNA-binding protein
MNMVFLIGNSGADAELKYTPNGTAIVNLSIATSEKRGDAYETHWHRIVLFGKTAESMAPRIKKGSQVFIQGKIFTRTWDDKQGNKKTSVEITANWVRIIQKDAPQSQEFGGGTGYSAGNYQPGPGFENGDIPF